MGLRTKFCMKDWGGSLDKQGIAHGLEDKVLHEGLGRVVVCLQLAHHVHQDASIEHRVAVNGGDDVRDALEGEGVDLLHDLGSPLHLLALETQKTLLSVVKLGELAPGGGVVEHSVVLLGEHFTNLIEIRIESHFLNY